MRPTLMIVAMVACVLGGLLGYSMAPTRVPESPSYTVVLFGDSVTAGYFEPGVLDQASGWGARIVPLLMAQRPGEIVNVINAGVPGDTAARGLARIERDVLSHGPDVVVVSFGLNDVRGDVADFRRTLTRIVRRLRGSRVVLVTPCFMCRKPDRAVGPHAKVAPEFVAYQTQGKLAAIAEAVRDVAREHGCEVADVYALWKSWEAEGRDTDALLANGLNHPSREAHAAMADLIAEALAKR